MLRDRRDLLILDEPSSGLDAEAEHEVHTRLREHRAGYTSVRAPAPAPVPFFPPEHVLPAECPEGVLPPGSAFPSGRDGG
ncbi:hypothetical protein ITP53_33830 [Nonomuraea sp. K274]|uniref:Uncharacterized protein n=1 Tax=Nonomuraea cypriaca TaxID=1187855 RepID=A0A931AHJ6_9ACTN|nr:hypothetical protein [Nonomuraea cypriaca]MBF8190608.1 hypothetical protein [Nonomuraea cypriaca]